VNVWSKLKAATVHPRFDQPFLQPVSILPTPGRVWLNAAVTIVRMTGRGLRLWQLIHYGSAVYTSWRDCPTIGPDGKPFWIDLRRTQFSWLVSGWRTVSLACLLRDFPSDLVALDIGAHIGTTTRLLASRFTSGHVYAFEPSPESYRQLARNSAGARNITCIQMALGRQNGEEHFSSSATVSAYRHIVPRGENTIAVPAMRLAEWVAQNGLTRIDFIKIDVEGFEEEVLIPAEATLRAFLPVIWFEYQPPFPQERSCYRGERLFPFLESLGYSICRLDEMGGRHQDFAEDGFVMSGDFLALPPIRSSKG
jgi:FkbM family methyltransferase